MWQGVDQRYLGRKGWTGEVTERQSGRFGYGGDCIRIGREFKRRRVILLNRGRRLLVRVIGQFLQSNQSPIVRDKRPGFPPADCHIGDAKPQSKGGLSQPEAATQLSNRFWVQGDACHSSD